MKGCKWLQLWGVRGNWRESRCSNASSSGLTFWLPWSLVMTWFPSNLSSLWMWANERTDTLRQIIIRGHKTQESKERNSWQAELKEESIYSNVISSFGKSNVRSVHTLCEARSTKAPKRLTLPAFAKVSRISASRELDNPWRSIAFLLNCDSSSWAGQGKENGGDVVRGELA